MFLRRAAATAAAIATALALWAVFLRPLPAHFRDGIPYSTRSGAPPAALVQGDHLQLLYHFDLLHCYLRGTLPPFRNLYEFNVGDDSSVPARPDFCYFPFALPYAALRELGFGRAAAWNACQLLAALLGFFLCRALARRYGAGSSGAATFFAALATCVPYRWVVLAGGSPTGFGMAAVPAVALGIDVAVRDGKARGGFLAGVALLCAYAADLHCFLFAGVALPFWVALSLTLCEEAPLASRRGTARLAKALAPAAAFGAFAAAVGVAAKRAYAATSAADGRSLADLERHSPDWHAFFNPDYYSHFPEMFHSGRIFPALLAASGLAVLAAAAVLAVAAIARRRHAGAVNAAAAPLPIVFHPAFSGKRDVRRRSAWRDCADARLVVAALLSGAAVVAVIFLALGTHGPCDALPIRVLRKLVPPFRLVRQPLKAFCLLPTIYAAFLPLSRACGALALRTARGLRSAAKPFVPVWRNRLGSARFPFEGGAGARAGLRSRERLVKTVLATALAAAVALDCARGTRTGICILPSTENAAYAAARDHAIGRGMTPRVLALPVWPGDSSWSSIYEHCAMQSGIRMLNGYAAVTRPEYVENVFRRFETLTEGDFTDDQLLGLHDLGVTALILHENAFPAKVSLCPFGSTLRRFFANPRLEFLGRDAGAWAFALKPAAPEAHSPEAGKPTHADALAAPRRPDEGAPVQDTTRPAALPLAGRSAPPTRFWRLDPPSAHAPAKARTFASIHDSGFGWLVAFAPDSNGVRRLSWLPDNGTKSDPWIHFEPPEGREIAFLACAESPDAFADAPILDAEVSPVSAPLRLAAADLRHDAGQTSVEDWSLDFAPGRDAPCIAAEGPDLPSALPRGRVAISLDSDAPSAFLVEPLYGFSRISTAEPRQLDETAIQGETNQAAACIVEAEGPGAPISVRVHWNGSAPAKLRAITFTPMPDQQL